MPGKSEVCDKIDIVNPMRLTARPKMCFCLDRPGGVTRRADTHKHLLELCDRLATTSPENYSEAVCKKKGHKTSPYDNYSVLASARWAGSLNATGLCKKFSSGAKATAHPLPDA